MRPRACWNGIIVVALVRTTFEDVDELAHGRRSRTAGANKMGPNIDGKWSALSINHGGAYCHHRSCAADGRAVPASD